MVRPSISCEGYVRQLGPLDKTQEIPFFYEYNYYCFRKKGKRFLWCIEDSAPSGPHFSVYHHDIHSGMKQKLLRVEKRYLKHLKENQRMIGYYVLVYPNVMDSDGFPTYFYISQYHKYTAVKFPDVMLGCTRKSVVIFFLFRLFLKSKRQ